MKNRISERLDRFLASSKWCNMFPNAKVVNGSTAHSDHAPIIMQMEGDTYKRSG